MTDITPNNPLNDQFLAIKDRVNEIEIKVKNNDLSLSEREDIINELCQIGISLGKIALEKIKRGDVL
jgi:hypothetical protein